MHNLWCSLFDRDKIVDPVDVGLGKSQTTKLQLLFLNSLETCGECGIPLELLSNNEP